MLRRTVNGIFLAFVIHINCQKTFADASKKVTVNAETLKYLSQFGYYKTSKRRVGSLQLQSSLSDSLRSLQRFAGLQETGELDEPTQILINTPRCGLPDNVHANRRKRRYVLQGSKWRKNELTWRLQNTNDDGLSRKQVESILQKAFSKWSSATNLVFSQLHYTANSKADIEIKFARNDHGDRFPFDNQGGTLAHAFYPHDNTGLSGDVHFDDDERFTINDVNGRNLLWVATHEIGHSLGLEHSQHKEAIMYPWYRKYLGEDFHLHEDDTSGIQNIYGRKQITTTPPPVTTAKVDAGFSCIDRISAILLNEESQETYVINRDKVFILDRDLVMIGYTIPLSTLFPGVESADSVYVRPNKKIVFFKDERFYEFYSMNRRHLVDKGLIYQKFFGLPYKIRRIDAAFNWRGNGRTYLFSGREYYRYDEWRRAIDGGYPKSIENNWQGLPSQVEAVFRWRNGKTYFFRESMYYRLNDRNAQIEKGYPRNIEGIWLNCHQESVVGNMNSGDIKSCELHHKLLIYITLTLYILLS